MGLRVAKGSVPWLQWWDTLDPYHYVRVAGPLNELQDLLIVGGEDHKTGQADDALVRFERLTAWAWARFPVLGRPLYRWSGQVMEPIDGLGFIGRNPGDEHVFIATGDSGNGMTHGTIAGMLLSDLILRRDNPWTEAYDPSRKSVEWNSAEKSWDCPCHGSRFDAHGHVINGPAVSDLAAATLPSELAEHGF